MPRSLLLLLLPFMFFAQDADRHEIKPIDDGEVYNVYSAVLALEKPGGALLIADTTVPFDLCLERYSDPLIDAAIEAYKKTNRNRWSLGYHMMINRPYELLSRNKADRLLQRDETTGDWPLSPSNGIHRFSAVGFNADKTMAFVEMDVVCGGLCGHGHPYILQKRDGRWKEYSPEAKIVVRKKTKDGTYQIADAGGLLPFCNWSY